MSILLTLVALYSSVNAQECVAPLYPLYEFQVDKPASYIGDTTVVPRPDPRRFVPVRDNPNAFVVQFVVDTAGLPEERSFKVLKAPSQQAVDSLRKYFMSWRFSAGSRYGCKVPQLVQTSVLH